MNTFSAGSSIRFGWEAFKKRPGFFIGVTIIVGIISWAFGWLGGRFQDSVGLHAIVYVISVLLSVMIDIGLRALMLKAHDNVDSATLEDLWHPTSYWSYLGAVILNGIIVVVGLILLIVPGIIAILAFMFTKLVVIDKKLGPVDALKESARITKGHRWELLALGILLILINILGAICLLVGLLVTIPLTMLAVVHAYRVLEQQAGPTPTV